MAFVIIGVNVFICSPRMHNAMVVYQLNVATLQLHHQLMLCGKFVKERNKLKLFWSLRRSIRVLM